MWFKELKEGSAPHIKILLIGNKNDLENNRAVKQETAIEYAKQNNMSFIETSELTNSNIE